MNLVGFGEVRAAANHNGSAAAVVLGHLLTKIFFNARHFVGGQKLAVGQLRQPVFVARNTRKPLHVAVPRSNIFVTNGPFYRKTIAGGAFKIKLRPALRLPRPHQRLAAHLVAPNPVERFFLDVRMLGIFYKKMRRIFVKSVALADDWVGIFEGFGNLPQMLKFPRVFVGGWVVGDVSYVASAFEYERTQTFASQFFGSPAAANSRANDDGIETVVSIYVEIRHSVNVGKMGLG